MAGSIHHCFMDTGEDCRNHPMTTLYDLIPVFGLVVTVAGISLKAGMILQKLDHVIDDVKDIKRELKELDKRVTLLENTGKL